jgi:hypothetical protein
MPVLFVLFLVSVAVFSQPVTVQIEELPLQRPKKTIQSTVPKVIMVDDFEDGDVVKFREWWSFDKVVIKPIPTPTPRATYVQKTAIDVTGASNNWYAGGIGAYLNEDVSGYDTLKLVIFSPKLNSGAIRIELYDDDNNNKIVDIDPLTGAPSKDDLLVHDINLVWKGWRVVAIPLTEFIDFNPLVGDNIWNPSKRYGSSGLTQMQLIILSSKLKSETISFSIDTIKFN